MILPHSEAWDDTEIFQQSSKPQKMKNKEAIYFCIHKESLTLDFLNV